MKDILNTLSKITISIMFACLAASCNTTDDINAIFRERTWYLTYIKDSNTERYPKKNLYSINFKNDNFEALMPNGAIIKGKWYADPDGQHTFNCTQTRVEGSITGDTIAERMYSILKNAQNYNGDTNWLQIKQDKNIYMQFYN